MVTLEDFIRLKFDMDSFTISDAKSLSAEYGNDKCRVLIDQQLDPKCVVICITDEPGQNLQSLKEQMDENYVHVMRDQDFIVLPYLNNRIRIPVFYASSDNLQNAFLTFLPNSFVVEGGVNGKTNIGGLLYQSVHECHLYPQEDVLPL